MTYDAIVIGSGHNGLAAAVHLARKGWKVAVFERAAVAGGAAKTAEITLPGFRHDLYATNLGLFAGSPFFRAYQEPLMRHGLGFVPAEHCFATPFPDGTWFGVSKGVEQTAPRVGAFSAADERTWRAMSEAFPADAPHLFGLLASPVPSLAALGVVYRAGKARGRAFLADTARLLVSSPRAFLDRTFESEKVKATLAAWGLHLDFPPDMAGGALFPYLESMADQAFGMALGQGGVDTMVKALTGYLAELGGELHLGAEVAAITVNGKHATGIRLADGRQFAASKAIIANLAPAALFGRLLPPTSVPDRVRTGMAAFRYGPGTMMVHLAMSALPDWSAGDMLKGFAYVHLAPDYLTMSRAYDECMAGLLPAEPVLVVGQPTAVDPSRAPEGRHVLWVQVRVVPAKAKGDAAGEIAPAPWSEMKERYADRVIAIIDRYAPGTSAKILGRAVLSPEDLEHDNPNLVGGDSLAGSHQLDQNFLFRPLMGWSRYRMPVKNLWLVGASTWPGAGLGAGSGFLAAKMLAGEPEPAAPKA